MTTQKEISEILRELAQNPNATSEPVLGVNIIEMQRGKNGGFPLSMYHQTLEPIHVLNRAQELAMIAKGYVRNYIFRHFPKAKFRRNMDSKFKDSGFVESVHVKDETQESKLQGAWFDNLESIPPIETAPTEDPAVTIARLMAENEGLRNAIPPAPRPVGRPKAATNEE